MREQIEYVNINTVVSDLKKKYLDLSVIEREGKIREDLLPGLSFRGYDIRVVEKPFFNPLANRQNSWYYLVCPLCTRNVRNLYILDNELKCSKCGGYADRREVKIYAPSDKLLRIQHYLAVLLDPSSELSTKKKKQYMRLIEKHYTELDGAYKKAYNNFLIRGLTSWCNRMLKLKRNSDDYKKAISDVLYNLKTMRLILTQKEMKKEKELK